MNSVYGCGLPSNAMGRYDPLARGWVRLRIESLSLWPVLMDTGAYPQLDVMPGILVRAYEELAPRTHSYLTSITEHREMKAEECRRNLHQRSVLSEC